MEVESQPRHQHLDGEDKPEASVVIVNRNNRSLLHGCLGSLQQDSGDSDVEFIVVDNGSSDDSVDWLQHQWPEVRLLVLGRNAGFCVGCNLGAAAARAPIVIFLNNDTVVKPGWLASLLRVFEHSEDVVVAGGLTLFDRDRTIVNSAGVRIGFSAAGTDIGFSKPRDSVDLTERDVPGVSGVSMAVRRSWFLQTGGFDERFFMYFEDVDLCLRAWLEGYRVRFVPDSVVWHAFGASAGSRYSRTRNYYASRNRMLTAFKLFSVPRLSAALLTSVVQDLLVVAWLTLAGQRELAKVAAAGKARGIFSALGSLPACMHDRRAFQRRRRRSQSDLRHLGVIDPVTESLKEFLRFRRL